MSVDVTDPRRIVESITGLVIQLSSVHEFALLGAALVFAVLACVVGVIWLRGHAAPLPANPGLARLALKHLCDRQSTLLLLTAALIVFGAFGYQKALWTWILRIPEGELGIGIVSEASADTLMRDLNEGLKDYGARSPALRPLPVRLDYRRPELVEDAAIDLGQRIGARAVLIHQPPASPPGASSEATENGIVAPLEPVRITVVFTDPDAGLTFDDRFTAAQPMGMPAAPSDPRVEKAGVTAPEFRSAGDDVRPLLAAAMGVVLYSDGDFPQAIALLEQAGEDSAAPHLQSRGLIDFYLGSAYVENGQWEAAIEAYNRAIAWYEERLEAGALGVQDELVLVKTYLERGRIEHGAKRWMTAAAWYEKGLGPLADDLHDGQAALVRPEEVYSTYAQLYGVLADVQRRLGNDDEADRRLNEGRQEAAALAASLRYDAEAPSRLDLARAYLALGDCGPALAVVEGVLADHPDDVSANLQAAALHGAMGRSDLVRQRLEAATEGPSIAAWRRSADYEYSSAIDFNVRNPELLSSPGLVQGGNVFEPEYLDRAARAYQHILDSIDATDPDAHRSLGAIASWRATALLSDLTAFAIGDVAAEAKSRRWVAEPEVWQAAVDRYGEAIAQFLEVTERHDPGRPSDWLNLAHLYSERQEMLAMVERTGDTQTDSKVDIERQFLADGHEVRRWADRLLAEDSPATTEQRLTVLTNVLATIKQEREWFRAFPWNEEQMVGREEELRLRIDEARALIASSPLETASAMQSAAALTSFEEWFFLWVKHDFDAGPTATARYDDLMERQAAADLGDIRHSSVDCETDRFSAEGWDLFYRADEDGGPDIKGARAIFQQGLTIEPRDRRLLVSASWTAYQEDDLMDAIALGERAVAEAPDAPTDRWNLALYRTATGAEVDETFNAFFAALRPLPLQKQMAVLRFTIPDLTDAHDRALLDDEIILAVVRRLERELGVMEEAARGTFQYPALYADLARIALTLDAPADAERLLLRRLSLDSVQPLDRAYLLLALNAQGRATDAALAALMADLSDPSWRGSSASVGWWREQIPAALQAHAELFPEDQPFAQTVLDTVTAEGIDGTTFRHPAFDYLVAWDDPWQLGGTISGNQEDLQLFKFDANEILRFSFTASDQFRGDPQQCLQHNIDSYARNNAVVSSPVLVEDILIAEDAEMLRASSVFDVPWSFEMSERFHHECWVIVPGRVTLLIEYRMGDSKLHEAREGDWERVLEGLIVSGQPAPRPATSQGAAATPTS